MTDFIIEILASEGIWNEELNPFPQQSVLMSEYNDGNDKQAYLTTHTNWPASMVILGAWDRGTGLQEGQTYDEDGETVLGTPTYALHVNYFSHIRKLGNEVGMATGHLDSHRWQGMNEQKFVDDSERYPSTNRPFTLKIERTLITDDGWPHIPHGWKVTMLSDDPLRDIVARAIGIYNDSWSYLYTTGAFIDDGSGTYFTECPIGQRTANEVDINFKLLLGAAPEGYWTLPISVADDERQFWTDDQ